MSGSNRVDGSRVRLSFTVTAALALGCGATRSPLPADVAPAIAPDAPFRAQPPAPLQIEAPEPPQLVSLRLANGLRVHILPRRGVPLASIVYVNRDAGNADPGDPPFLPELTAAALLEGTETEDGQLMKDLLVSGVPPEASVCAEGTYVSLELLAPAAGKAIELLGAIVRRPTLHDDGIATASERARQLISQRSNQLGQLAQRFRLEAAFGKSHPFPRSSVDIARAIERLKMADVRRYHRERYRPSRSTVIVVGDVDPVAIQADAARAFGSWPEPPLATPGSALAPVAPRAQGRRRVYALWNQGPLSVVTVFVPGMTQAAADAPQLELLMRVLGRRLHSRLSERLPAAGAEDKRVRQGDSVVRGVQVFTVSSVVASERVGEAAAIMLQELERMATKFDEQDLALARALHVRARTSATSLSIGQLIGESDALGRPLQWVTEPAAQLQALTVSKARRILGAALRPQQAIVLVTGNARSTQAQLSHLGRIETLTVATP